MRDNSTTKGKGSPNIDLVHQVVLVHRQVCCLFEKDCTSIVYQNINFAKPSGEGSIRFVPLMFLPFDNLIDCNLNLFVGTDVAGNWQGSPAQLLNLFSDSVDSTW